MNDQLVSRTRDDEEIDLGAVGRTLWKGRWWLVGITVAGLGASIAFSRAMTVPYQASVTLMQTDSPGSRGGFQDSPLAGLLPGGTIPRGDTAKLIALLRSRNLAERTLEHQQLFPLLAGEQEGALTREDASLILQGMIQIDTEPGTGLIEVSAKHLNPQLAAKVANGYVDELDAFLQENSFTAARRQRLFLEKQVSELNADIRTIENRQIAFQQDHQLIALDAQTSATIQTYTTLKAQLMAKETELQMQANSMSPYDIEYIGLKREVGILQGKLTALEQSGSGGLLAFKDAPSLGVRLAQFQRELSTKQKVFDLLTQQLEMARMEESKEGLSFQVIDRAKVPPLPSGPKQTTIWLLGGILSFTLAVFLVLGVEGIRSAQPANVRKSKRLVQMTR